MVLYLWQNCMCFTYSRLVNYSRYANDEDIRACGIASSLFPFGGDMVVPGLNYDNVNHDIKLVADKTSYRPCPWNPKLGLVFLN